MSTNKKQQENIENYEIQRDLMLQRGYTWKEVKISIVQANVIAIVSAIPLILLMLFVYIQVWDEFTLTLNLKNMIILLLLSYFFIPIHEGLHAIGWVFFCKNRFKSINLGVLWKLLTPYCHCKEPLTYIGYMTGLLFPFLFIGLGLFIIALCTNNLLLLLVSFFNVSGATGDLMVAFKMFKYRRALLIDLPVDCGFAAFEK